MQIRATQFDASFGRSVGTELPADGRQTRTEEVRAAEHRRDAAAAEARRDESAAEARRATGAVLDAVGRLRGLEHAATLLRTGDGSEAEAPEGVPATLGREARAAYAATTGPACDGAEASRPAVVEAEPSAAVVVHPLRWRGTILDVVA